MQTDHPTDRPTDKPTDRPTDIVTYRDAIEAKKGDEYTHARTLHNRQRHIWVIIESGSRTKNNKYSVESVSLTTKKWDEYTHAHTLHNRQRHTWVIIESGSALKIKNSLA